MFILIIAVLSPILTLPIGYLILIPVKNVDRWIKYFDHWIGFYAFFIWGGINILGSSKSMVNGILVEPLCILSFFILVSLIKMVMFKFCKNIPYKIVAIICDILIIMFVVILGLFCPKFAE